MAPGDWSPLTLGFIAAYFVFKSLFYALYWHLWLCWRASCFISDHLLLKNLLRTLKKSGTSIIPSAKWLLMEKQSRTTITDLQATINLIWTKHWSSIFPFMVIYSFTSINYETHWHSFETINPVNHILVTWPVNSITWVSCDHLC